MILNFAIKFVALIEVYLSFLKVLQGPIRHHRMQGWIQIYCRVGGYQRGRGNYVIIFLKKSFWPNSSISFWLFAGNSLLSSRVRSVRAIFGRGELFPPFHRSVD